MVLFALPITFHLHQLLARSAVTDQLCLLKANPRRAFSLLLHGAGSAGGGQVPSPSVYIHALKRGVEFNLSEAVAQPDPEHKFYAFRFLILIQLLKLFQVPRYFCH